MMCPFELTKHGYENQYNSNHLSHFLLTMLLTPKLKASGRGRVVNVASEGQALTIAGTSEAVISQIHDAKTYNIQIACMLHSHRLLPYRCIIIIIYMLWYRWCIEISQRSILIWVQSSCSCSQFTNHSIFSASWCRRYRTNATFPGGAYCTLSLLWHTYLWCICLLTIIVLLCNWYRHY